MTRFNITLSYITDINVGKAETYLISRCVIENLDFVVATDLRITDTLAVTIPISGKANSKEYILDTGCYVYNASSAISATSLDIQETLSELRTRGWEVKVA
jgi:hypothetical protein